jgi:hypothetical protein
MASPLGVAASTAAGALDGRVVDLRHLFDSYPSPTFLGLVHQNETGAAIIAQRIFSDPLPVLRSRVSSR